MDRETLNEETLAAEEAGDSQRVKELARLERLNRLDETTPKYADGADTGGESGLSARASRAAELARAGGNEASEESLQAVAEADDPAQELSDQETVVRHTLGEDAAEALTAL